MRHRLPLLLLPLFLFGCGEEDTAESPAPLSPQEMYEKGRALLKPNAEQNASDFAQALSWTRRAAEAGWKQAQTDLGGLYMYGGKGVTVDGAEALKWFTRAAEQGSSEAEVFIGDLYKQGLGVRADMGEAVKHWRVAAEAGIGEAQQRLGHELVRQPGKFSEGLEWLKQAATKGLDRGKANAASDLGTIYARGLGGVKPDMQEAARWYAIGAEGGNAEAQHIYAIMLLTGDPIEQDVKTGEFMLRCAASQDYLPAIAHFVLYLRQAPNATPEQKKEADAWEARQRELMMKRRTQAAPAAQPQPHAAQ